MLETKKKAYRDRLLAYQDVHQAPPVSCHLHPADHQRSGVLPD